MNKLFLVSCLLFFSFTSTVCCQNFVSDIEKEMFNKFEKDSINYDFLKSICAIDSSFTDERHIVYKRQLDEIIHTLPSKEQKDSKEKKRIKKIYNIIHDRFFVKYNLEAVFTDIFKNGTYNCVSASALYSYVFDELNIPYQVKELPSHVFLIAYPETLKIYLETTAPGAYGFYSPSKSQIEKIVNELIELKLVANHEVQAKGYSKVYQDYFFGNKYLNKSSLIGMQYFNECMKRMADENYDKALYSISKSMIFYKSPFSKKISSQLILENISEMKFDNKESIDFLYSNLSKLQYKKDIETNSIKGIIYGICNNNKNDFIEEIAIKFSTFKDNQLNELFKKEFYEYLSANEAEKYNFDKALKYCDTLFKINSANKRTKEIVLFSVSRKFSVMTSNDESISLMDNFIEKYSFLEGDKRIETIRVYLFAQLARTSFINRNSKKGLEYLNSFEKIMDTQKDNVQIPPDLIADLYLIVGRYYFGNSKFRSSLRHFNKGLEYSPNNSELNKMSKWAKEDLR